MRCYTCVKRTRVRIEYHFYKNQNTNVSDRAAGSGEAAGATASGGHPYRARTPFRTLRPLSRALYSV